MREVSLKKRNSAADMAAMDEQPKKRGHSLVQATVAGITSGVVIGFFIIFAGPILVRAVKLPLVHHLWMSFVGLIAEISGCLAWVRESSYLRDSGVAQFAASLPGICVILSLLAAVQLFRYSRRRS